jgi:1,4-alpha-glucan branching enzyme
MGNELGQLREWDEMREQDWDMLKYPMHDSFAKFMSELSRLYLTTPPLYERDHSPEGFSWVDCEQKGDCAYAFNRYGEFEKLTALFNFSYEEKYYELDVPKGEYKVILDSDWECFSGNTKKEKKTYRVSDGKLKIKLAPYSAKYLISNY